MKHFVIVYVRCSESFLAHMEISFLCIICCAMYTCKYICHRKINTENLLVWMWLYPYHRCFHLVSPILFPDPLFSSRQYKGPGNEAYQYIAFGYVSLKTTWLSASLGALFFFVLWKLTLKLLYLFYLLFFFSRFVCICRISVSNWASACCQASVQIVLNAYEK